MESDPPAQGDAGLEAALQPDAFLPDGDAALPGDAPDGSDAPLMQPCAFPVASAPIVLVSLPDQHCEAPSLAVLRNGESQGQPASVAVQVFSSGGSYGHPEVRAAAIQIGQTWQEPVVLEHPLIVVGNESHGWGEMARSTGGATLGFAWHTDMGGSSRPAFRTLDIATWSPGPVVELAPQGEAVLSISAGRAAGPMGIGYGGQGYGVVWRDYVHGADGGIQMRPVAAVLDDTGMLMIGPHAVAPPTDYPGRSPSIAWTGSTYLLATSFRGCPYQDSLCEPRSVVIARLRPASGDAWDDSGVERAVAMTATQEGAIPGRAALASRGELAWAAWFEGDPDNEAAPRVLRVAPLSANGDKLSAPVTVATGVVPTTAVRLQASELGLSCTWSEDGDSSLPAGKVGRSRIRVLVLDHNAQPQGPALAIDTTLVNTYGWTSSVALTSPRSLIVSWTGTGLESFQAVAWGARVDCK